MIGSLFFSQPDPVLSSADFYNILPMKKLFQILTLAVAAAAVAMAGETPFKFTSFDGYVLEGKIQLPSSDSEMTIFWRIPWPSGRSASWRLN